MPPVPPRSALDVSSSPHRGLGSDLLAEIRGRTGLLVPFAENARGSFARTCRKRTGLTEANVQRACHAFGLRWNGDRGIFAGLQAVLGHQDPGTTQGYARVTDDLVRGMKRIEERRQGT